jgi:hypothetical protein
VNAGGLGHPGDRRGARRLAHRRGDGLGKGGLVICLMMDERVAAAAAAQQEVSQSAEQHGADHPQDDRAGVAFGAGRDGRDGVDGSGRDGGWKLLDRQWLGDGAFRDRSRGDRGRCRERGERIERRGGGRRFGAHGTSRRPRNGARRGAANLRRRSRLRGIGGGLGIGVGRGRRIDRHRLGRPALGSGRRRIGRGLGGLRVGGRLGGGILREERGQGERGGRQEQAGRAAKLGGFVFHNSCSTS